MTSFVVEDEILDPEIRDAGKSFSSGIIDSELGRALEMTDKRGHPACLKTYRNCEFSAFKETYSSLGELSS